MPGGKTPRISFAEAEALGYRLAILPGLLLGAVMVACDHALRAARESGITPETPRTAGVADTFRRFGADEWNGLRQRFAKGRRLMAKSLFEKVWDAHVCAIWAAAGRCCILIANLLHDLSGPPALRGRSEPRADGS
ncbi:MAG: hypothetical protein WDM89_06160 [Rhizomicrobium sp.]